MRSIRSKLIVATLSIAVFVAIVMTIVACVEVKKSINFSLKETIEPLAVQAAESVEFNVRSLESVAEQLAATLAGSSDPSAELNDYIFVDGYLNAVALFSKSGDVLASETNPQTKDVSFSSATALATGLAQTVVDSGKTLISEPVATPEGDMKLYVFAKSGANNYVCLQYDFEKINDILAVIEVSENSYVYVTDQTGLVVFHKDETSVNGTYNPMALGQTDKEYKGVSKFVKKALADESGSGNGNYDFEDDSWYAGYALIDDTNWTLVVATPFSDFSSQMTAAVILSLVFCILSLALVFGFTFFFARTISKPIVSTTKRLRALSQGNLSDPVDVSYSKDELGVLSNSLEETIVSLRQYINQITATLTYISEGNLTQRIEGNFKGDFVKIKTTFNNILVSLSETFSSINSAAEQVNNGASQVAGGSQSLSQGATEQASSIEQLSATVQDVSDQISANVESARTANQIVQDNARRIHECNSDMENMLGAMDRIKVSSAEISKIIKVIDEIAFQTNILALNAAVEAARAGGAAGKSFTVVADEVRRLASKTAEAAKQTAVLIEDSVDTVKQGTQIAEETATALNEIVEGYSTIETLVGDISDAFEHQSEAIVQINTGVSQISSVVQANTSTAIEYASASEQLSGQSLILRNMITRFKLLDSKGKRASSSNSYDYQSYDAPSAPSYPSGGFDYPSDTPSGGFEYPSDEPASNFDYPSDEPASNFEYPSDEPTSNFDYPSDEPASNFDYPSDDESPFEYKSEEVPASNFEYPSDEPSFEFPEEPDDRDEFMTEDDKY